MDSLLLICVANMTPYIRLDDLKLIPSELREVFQRNMPVNRQKHMFDCYKVWFKGGHQLAMYVPLVNGKSHGKAYYWYSTGQMHTIVDWQNGCWHGKRKMWYTDGLLKEKSHWINGKKHGKYIEYRQPNGVKSTEYWVDGNRVYTRHKLMEFFV